jgi:N-methylhydantoinase A
MRVAFDIGGTFTDVMVIGDDGRIVTTKVLSLLDRVGEDIVACLRPLAQHEVECFIHGTTIASNAIIEGKTAPTVLITTRGFRDNLEMRGERRPNLQDPNWIRSPALVPRRLRLEVNERILGDGTIERALNHEEVRALLRRLATEPIEALAVSFINAYINPIHEQQLRSMIVSELGPDVTVCLSSEIYPQIREYERTSTTVINASLVPVIDRYLNQVENHLAVYSDRLLIMQSNGGIMSAQAARRKPAYMIESGPAAGVLAAARLAREAGLEKILSFDMGGTTAKACLIENAVPAEKAAGEIGAAVNTTTHLFYKGGHALIVPSLDIVEVGAGGGSIAWVEEGGTLRVGPRSAGAEPGPVCYGRGGDEPTVTDANVVLGYMNPEAIAGSALRIDYGAAFDAIKRFIADPLRLEVMDAAFGITQIANSLMMRALRAVSTERGRDPRDFTLVAFGGAGPIHAAGLAETMEISRLLVPVFPGLFSALGLLLADYRHDYIRSIVTRLESVQRDSILACFSELEQAALAEMHSEGVDREAIKFERYADLKYGYQLQELTLAFPQIDVETEIAGLLQRLFTEAHERAFGYRADDPVELVSLRVRALASAGRLRFDQLSKTAGKLNSVRAESGHCRQVYFGRTHGLLRTPISGREDVREIQAGPMIIEEPDTTVVVPPGWSVGRDEFSNLVLSNLAASSGDAGADFAPR